MTPVKNKLTLISIICTKLNDNFNKIHENIEAKNDLPKEMKNEVFSSQI